MSDDVDNPDTSDSEPQGPRAGERLAEARREQKIAVIEIAKELHLDEHKVRALERNEFDVLGAPVFAKGYLKKYAQLVHIKAEDVLADYYRLNRAAEAPPVVSSRQRPRQELSPGPWITVVVVIVLIVTAYVWFARPEAPDVPLTDRVAEEDTTSVVSPVDEGLPQQDAADDASAAAESEVEEPEVVQAPGVQQQPESRQEVEVQEAQPPVEETSSPAIADGQVRILLTYTGDCWTEVTDATGRRLLFSLGKDGRSVELSGAEPLSVLFGSPYNVEVAVNGEPFAMPETARPDRPFRLTISGS
jgi:cytoskeleton protein RodZ